MKKKDNRSENARRCQKADRVLISFNTGTRYFKSPKDYTRKQKHKKSLVDDVYTRDFIFGLLFLFAARLLVVKPVS